MGSAADRIRLTAHPMQRIGAYALACLAHGQANCRRPDPETLDPADFAAAVEVMTGDAIRAATGPGTKAPEGFFLKSSLSIFPNSVMNHPSNGKRSTAEIADRVRTWRCLPDTAGGDYASSSGISVPCVLCSRPAAGFYGKVDVPLAESDAYRNTTPRGHEGMALCWPCRCCFHALPYGSHLTGGPCLAMHSWDERFLARTVARQVAQTRQIIEVGSARYTPLRAREVLVLRALRGYEHDLRAGVELLVFSNNNRGPTLDIVALEQAMAEWLRRTMNRPVLARGFRALVRAHRTATQPGYVGLARNAFRAPERILGACATYLATTTRLPGHLGEQRAEEAPALAALCFDYADRVMLMDRNDLEEIRATGCRIALLIEQENRAGKLREFYSRFKDAKQLRSWLQREAVEWVLRPREGQEAPLLTTHGFGLLFDPDIDNQAWFHRQMLLVAVVEELYRSGWRPESCDGPAELPEFEMEDDQYVVGADDREDEQ